MDASANQAKSDRFVIWLTTNPVSTWMIRNVASRLDPVIFRASNGKFFSMGVPNMPMLTLTTGGRHSGRPRSVHLACVEHEGDYLIVASAMGQEKHPAWSYNIEANPEVELQLTGERFKARARRLTDGEKNEVWDEMGEAIPQIYVYEKRTGRNIRVFRLSRTHP